MSRKIDSDFISTPPSTTRRAFLYSAGACAALTIVPTGCSSASSATTSTALVTTGTSNQPVPSGNTLNVSLQLTNARQGTIGTGFYGLSIEKGNVCTGTAFSGSASNMIALFKLLGPGVLRVGGASVEGALWTAAGPGGKSGQIAPADVTRLAAFLAATGWEVIYGINLATSTPTLAAAEAAYAVNAFGASLVGIEIGNEPDFYYGNTGLTGTAAASWTVAQYVTAFQSFVAAILATTPKAPIVGPALEDHLNWLQTFAGAGIANLVLFTAHYYVTSSTSANATIPTLLTYPNTALQSYQSSVYQATAGSGIPYRIGECNSLSGGGLSGVSNTCASALWAIETIFTMAQGGASGVNFHTIGGTNGYTPIVVGTTDATGVQPECYGILFSILAGTGTLLEAIMGVSGLNSSAFAVSTSSSGTNVIVVNKDASSNLLVSLTAVQAVSKASVRILTMSSLSATVGTAIQGATIGADGTFAPAAAYTLATTANGTSFYVPAMSAVLVNLS